MRHEGKIQGREPARFFSRAVSDCFEGPTVRLSLMPGLAPITPNGIGIALG